MRKLTAALSAALVCLPGLADAQSSAPPPRHDSTSETGVSYRDGSFNYQDEDLSIGGGFPSGLSLNRTYRSSGSTANTIGNAQGWSTNLSGFMSITMLPVDPYDPPLKGREPYVYSVVFGGKSIGFLGGSKYSSTTTTGGAVGTYKPISQSGASLVYDGTTDYNGSYTFTDSDGTVVRFTQGRSGIVDSWTMPDGTVVKYNYLGGALKSVSNNRGWAILIESTLKACAINMARVYVDLTGSCPQVAQSVTYILGSGVYNTSASRLVSSTRAGETTSYMYNSFDHLACVKRQGDSTCDRTTTYAACPEDPAVPTLQADLHLHDYVTSQTESVGRSIQYTYDYGDPYPARCPRHKLDTNPDSRAISGNTASMMINASMKTDVSVNAAGMLTELTDPLSHKYSFAYYSNPVYPTEAALYKGVTLPEGNSKVSGYDNRANVISEAQNAKPGTGLSPITQTRSFPPDCGNIIICNKPEYALDPKGKRTDFTYDPVHGGILTETAPADVNGLRAVKRYAYVQRFAWTLNSSGSYTKASSPIWMLATLKQCRTSATSGDQCVAGTSDEIVTTYEYGPNSGPNNLLLRGVSVSADGVTRRTCYGYDQDGNRISETKPQAGLSVCP